ncbi:MAG TPA: dTDP-4-dehydrorhamnose reductase [Candidatus Competibacteraceae bacterium]|nr:dTDP-4-dehydrorhamnose reductase [Candidatus Competibacteraceae bacterium]
MRLLLTGANGQVGWEIARRAAAYGLMLDARDRAGLDITDAPAVARAVAGADLVINAAAYTAVDRAEQDEAAAFAVNCDGPALLAAACAERGIPLFQLSTDYVFDGTKPGPWQEDDPAAPLGVYGQSKWQGEQAVRARLARHLILRVSWVFGRHGHNFVKTMLRLAREREELRVVADQVGRPTCAADIAAVLLELARRHAAGSDLAWGTYHYGGEPAVSWHEFACAIVAEGRAREPLAVQRVVAIGSADYPTPARRPANSVLDCSRLAATFGIAPRPWLSGLRRMLDERD